MAESFKITPDVTNVYFLYLHCPIKQIRDIYNQIQLIQVISALRTAID